MSDLYTVLWKETREMLRDRKTLLIVVLAPIITLPFMGLAVVYLPTVQEVVVSVVDEDRSEALIGNFTISSQFISHFIQDYLKHFGFTASEGEVEVAQVVLRIPAGFIANLTSYENQASVVLLKKLGSPRVDQAVSYIEALLNYLSKKVSEIKVLTLGEIAGVNLKTEAVLSPIATKTVILMPTGAPAEAEEGLKLHLSRMLALSLAFVTTPAASYIADSLIGEKERKTLEKLLSTPISRSSFIFGKSLVASFIGLVGGASNVVGGVLLFIAPTLLYSSDLVRYLSLEVMLTLFLSSYTSILVSLSISLPIVLRSPSIRAASISSTSIIGIASVMYIASLFINLDELRMPLSLILAIPYASLASAIIRVSLGESLRAVGYLAYSLFLSVAFILISTKLLDPERMIASRS
ncbi:MAG: ABC transporter permease subunit [Sulfolobales archaeon]|nr:ABC transporter permease subunit [Sulfolobales archaeon]MDW8082345.1 ABC transporter permease subunit [Sulfolobales archaeon]